MGSSCMHTRTVACHVRGSPTTHRMTSIPQLCLPACPPACLPACLSARLPARLPLAAPAQATHCVSWCSSG